MANDKSVDGGAKIWCHVRTGSSSGELVSTSEVLLSAANCLTYKPEGQVASTRSFPRMSAHVATWPLGTGHEIGRPGGSRRFCTG
jgi:hypothetical protein